jgi:hypothetical protein
MRMPMKKTITPVLLGTAMLLCVMTAGAQTVSLSLIQSIQGDTLQVDLYLQATQPLPDSLGDATFVFEYDHSRLSCIGKDEYSDGRWDDDFSDGYCDLSSSHVSPNVSLDVIKSGIGDGLGIPAEATRVGRILFRIEVFDGISGVSWSSAIPSAVYSWNGEDITSHFILSSPGDFYLSVPIAGFSADTTLGFTPCHVRFTDHSSGLITNWYWDFGDGSISTEQNPEYTYTEPDTFSVSLTVTGPGGSDTKIRENYIIIMSQTSVTDPFVSAPVSYQLYQNYPNPFNPETRFCYQLPEESTVSILIYSLLGQKIRDVVHAKQPAGHYEGIWNGKDDLNRDVPSGIYILQIHAGSFRAVRRMTLLR